ncbi:MAG: BON domain-containing protein [Luteitalea sp.]|nr:BON domain-containing protein [Luteitalea sp.]
MNLSRRLLVGLLAIVVTAPLAAGCAQRVSRQTDDSTIQVRVTTALLNDPEIKGSAIDVAVTNGVVTLTGPVRSKSEVQQALKLARSISGVTEVRSKLKVP